MAMWMSSSSSENSKRPSAIAAPMSARAEPILAASSAVRSPAPARAAAWAVDTRTS